MIIRTQSNLTHSSSWPPDGGTDWGGRITNFHRPSITYVLYSHAAHTFGPKRARSVSGVDAAEYISRSAIGLVTLRNQLDVPAMGGYYCTTPQPMKGGIRSSSDAWCVLTACISQITIDETYGKLNAVSAIHAYLEEDRPVAHGGYSCVLMRTVCAFWMKHLFPPPLYFCSRPRAAGFQAVEREGVNRCPTKTRNRLVYSTVVVSKSRQRLIHHGVQIPIWNCGR